MKSAGSRTPISIRNDPRSLNQFGRSVALGRDVKDVGVGLSGPGVGTPTDPLQCGFTQIPVIEYVTWTVPLPISDGDIKATFGNTIDLLTDPKSVQGVASVDSSFVINGLLQVDMVCVGFGFHVFADPFSFSQIGTAISTDATAPIWSMDSFTLNDVNNDAMGSVEANAGTPVPAILEWGFPAWQAAWELANAYQLIWRFQQRYLLVNELAADVCFFGPFAEAVAAGTSEIPVQPYALQANAAYRQLAATKIFQPIVARRVGSLTAGAPGTVNTAISHVTSDFALASATHGGLRNQGGFANGHPFRRLMKPVILEKAVPIGLTLQAQDEVHQSAMQRYMSISEGKGTSDALVSFDTVLNGETISGSASAGLEQTVDATPTVSAQRTNTDRYLFKGGTLKLSMQVKGFELFGGWKQQLLNTGAAIPATSLNGAMGSVGAR